MSSQEVLYQVSEVIEDRKMNPQEGSYTNYLFDKGLDKILKKVGEEATETIIAAKNQEKEEIVYEIADLIYHLTVLMAVTNITWDDILSELQGGEPFFFEAAGCLQYRKRTFGSAADSKKKRQEGERSSRAIVKENCR